MARVSLSNGHHGTVWVCQTATFSEGEEREWDSFATHAAFATRTEAIMWASRLAHDYAGVLSLFLAVDGSDGVSVDVQPRFYDGRDYEPYAITGSWEVVPGRPVTEWHGDECRDVGCPRSRSRRTDRRETLIWGFCTLCG